jgi:cytidylate kinase
MVKIITVEREYGSAGAEFAHKLADRLGWKLVDHSLIDEIAQEAGIPKSMAESCDERLDPWYYRVGKAFWHGSVERLPAPPVDSVFDSERMVRMVRNYLKECADCGHCVIVGRGAACALSQTPGVFNLFIYASMTRKIRWFEEHFPQQASQAKREIEAADSRRESYIRRYYNMDWADRRLYHMMINSCIGFEAMIQVALEGIGGAGQTAATRRPGTNG